MENNLCVRKQEGARGGLMQTDGSKILLTLPAVRPWKSLKNGIKEEEPRCVLRPEDD
jgi:hypothetical protein